MKNMDIHSMTNIIRRAHYISNQMIFEANIRQKEKGDPKVGGHSSACSSALHIMGAIHLILRKGYDFIVNKPHAAPLDHAYNYLLNLFLKKDFKRFSPKEALEALFQLRAFSKTEGQAVFQSYHSSYDPDHTQFLPSGSVGIPPVNLGYLAQAFSFISNQSFKVPQGHFWALMGDSEFREGSLLEAAPDFAEREIGNVTWIVDYNRQSLDGHRVNHPSAFGGSDALRIENTMKANGWKVFQAQHGKKRLLLFNKKGGHLFKEFLESQLSNYELQVLFQMKDSEQLKSYLEDKAPSNLKKFLKSIPSKKLFEAFHDLGGHDIEVLSDIFRNIRKNSSSKKPSLVIAHTIKGWGLKMAALGGNHSYIPSQEEMLQLREKTNLSKETLFAPFEKGSKEDEFLKKKGDEIYKEILEFNQLKKENESLFFKKYNLSNDVPKNSKKSLEPSKGSIKKSPQFHSHDSFTQYKDENHVNLDFPKDFNINLKLVQYPHTQWMLGQITSKLTRIANTPMEKLSSSGSDRLWKSASEMIVLMAPDVGTSTNLNPSMDNKVYGVKIAEDIEEEMNLKDLKSPTILPLEKSDHRFLRFEIAEASSMSCLGSYGHLQKAIGVPVLPLMTVYDFFIKRALDQYFYNLYWASSFILVGTPSGVTLSPEGAQHAWKSDFQIPNQITWEPFFCIELDWILAHSIQRHFTQMNQGRSGVLIRTVTRGIDQKLLLENLETQRRFKKSFPKDKGLLPQGFEAQNGVPESEVPSLSENEILELLRKDVLEGAYYLKDYRGYFGYEPGENVIHIFSMGSPSTEALLASQNLLKKGIYANVIIVTSPDLLIGTLGEKNNYHHLKETLGIHSNLYFHQEAHSTSRRDVISYESDWVSLAGKRVPLLSVHDGEPGLLDNIGSIVGLKQISLAVKKHSRSGTPKEIYKFHNMDALSIEREAEKILLETQLECVKVSKKLIKKILN